MSKLKTIAVKLAKGNRYEKPDPTPRSLPLGYKARSGPTMHERMRSMLREERSLERMRAAGIETEDEANDFEIDDDPTSQDPLTKHELADLEGTAKQIIKQGAGGREPPPAPEPIPVPENQKGKITGAISSLAKLFAGKTEEELAVLLKAEDNK